MSDLHHLGSPKLILVCALPVLMALGFLFQWLFAGRLRATHPDAWEKLSRPTFMTLNSALNRNTAIRSFVWRGGARALGDKALEILVLGYRLSVVALAIDVLGIVLLAALRRW